MGIVSAGMGCGHESFPGIFTSVSYYSQWIQDTIDNNTEDDDDVDDAIPI